MDTRLVPKIAAPFLGKGRRRLAFFGRRVGVLRFAKGIERRLAALCGEQRWAAADLGDAAEQPHLQRFRLLAVA
jgi:hypothetical protein